MRFNEAKKILKDYIDSKQSILQMASEAGMMAKNHFVQSFRNQGFTDETLQPWKRREGRDIRGRGRAILVKTGALRRSIRLQRASAYKIIISSNMPYAQIHNDGGRTGRGGIMPKRQFIGYSGVLNRKIIAKFDKRIKKIFK